MNKHIINIIINNNNDNNMNWKQNLNLTSIIMDNYYILYMHKYLV